MLTIGRSDKADFPELSLKNINVKIDTGAYTSTIHSHDIKEVNIDGTMHLVFKILDPTHPKYRDEEFMTPHYRKKSVKSSFGQSEDRFVVETSIMLFGEAYPIALTLSERGDMKYPILIGRTLLKKRFVVDPSKKNLSYKLKRETAKKKSEL
jgi:hypothetical protein